MYETMSGASVAQLSEQAPFTSEIVGSILATDSCEKSQSTLCRKLWVFSGCSGFLPQGKLTGWVRINTAKKVITIVVKINSLHGKKRRAARCSTGLNNVLLPTLFTLVNNIEQCC